MKCLNVIILYDNYNEIIEYLDSAYNSISLFSNLDVAIVINKDTQRVATKIEEYSKERNYNVALYDFKENVGYLNSLMYIVKNIKIDDYNYFILSNTDIKYDTSNFFDKLFSTNIDDDIGCIAPSVYCLANNSYSNPHYTNRVKLIKFKFLSMMFSFPKLAHLYIKLSSLKANKNKRIEKPAQYVYSPHGCYMIFTKRFIKSIKGFEYGVRMYSEESCIGELLLKNNFKCKYDPSIRITHMESAVTGKIDYHKRFSMWKESIDWIIKKFY